MYSIEDTRSEIECIGYLISLKFPVNQISEENSEQNYDQNSDQKFAQETQDDESYEDFSEKFSKSKKNTKSKYNAAFDDKITLLLKTWLFTHENHPYPTEDEKFHLMKVTDLTIVQINNWFSNARRRILKFKRIAKKHTSRSRM